MIASLYTYYLGYRIFIKKYQKDIFSIGKVKKKEAKQLLVSLILGFILIRLMWIIFFYLFSLFGLEIGEEEALSTTSLISILYVVFLGPIAEELVFRGWSINLLKKYGSFTAILLSSIAFGLFHGNIFQGIPAIFIGFILAYIRIRYQALWPCMLLHIVNNGLSMFQQFESQAWLVYIYIIFGIVGLILFLIRNRFSIKEFIQRIVFTFKLSYHSLSYMSFIVLAIVLMVLSVIQV